MNRVSTALLAAALSLGGCSDGRLPTHPTEGRVVFPDGEPVMTGVIELQSLQHALNARGEVLRDGSFVLGTYDTADGAVAGRHRAIVIQFLAIDSHPRVVHDHGDPIDPRYADYDSSQLEFVIEEGRNFLQVTVERMNQPAPPRP